MKDRRGLRIVADELLPVGSWILSTFFHAVDLCTSATSSTHMHRSNGQPRTCLGVRWIQDTTLPWILWCRSVVVCRCVSVVGLLDPPRAFGERVTARSVILNAFALSKLLINQDHAGRDKSVRLRNFMPVKQCQGLSLSMSVTFVSIPLRPKLTKLVCQYMSKRL